MNTYYIFHPADGSLNALCSTNLQFKKVASVQADSLTDAFALAQNFHENSYTRFNVRSTSVGDIIVSDLGAFMVRGSSFEKIDDFSTLNEVVVNNMTADLEEPSNDVKSFSFNWNKLRQGDFPSELIHKWGLGLKIEEVSTFVDIITILAKDEKEDFSPETIFQMGMAIGLRMSLK